MGLLRVTYTKPLPPNAEILTRQHKGKPRRFVRLTEGGKPAYYPLTKKGNAYLVPSAKWYGKYRDEHGVEQKVPLSENKAVAQQMLSELLRKVELAKVGVRDPFERHRRRPLAEHLNDWEATLRGEGATAKHVRQAAGNARKVVEGCGFAFTADLSASAVQGFLASL